MNLRIFFDEIRKYGKYGNLKIVDKENLFNYLENYIKNNDEILKYMLNLDCFIVIDMLNLIHNEKFLKNLFNNKEYNYFIKLNHKNKIKYLIHIFNKFKIKSLNYIIIIGNNKNQIIKNDNLYLLEINRQCFFTKNRQIRKFNRKGSNSRNWRKKIGGKFTCSYQEIDDILFVYIVILLCDMKKRFRILTSDEYYWIPKNWLNCFMKNEFIFNKNYYIENIDNSFCKKNT